MQITTKYQLLESLRRLNSAEWQLKTVSSKGEPKMPSKIRLGNGNKTYCPITAVHYDLTGKFCSSARVYEAGIELGLSFQDITDLVTITDDETESNLRRQLETSLSHLL